MLFSQDPIAKDTPHNQAFISNLQSKPLMDAWSTGPVTVSAKGDLIFNSNGDSKGGRGTQTFLYALSASNAVYRVSGNIVEDESFFTTNVFRGIILKKDGLHTAGVLSTPFPPETKREDPSAWSRYIETYYAVSNISFDTSPLEPWVYRIAELQKPETNVQTDRAFIQNLLPRNLVDCYGMETEIFDNGDIALNGSKRGILKFWFARSPTEGFTRFPGNGRKPPNGMPFPAKRLPQIGLLVWFFGLGLLGQPKSNITIKLAGQTAAVRHYFAGIGNSPLASVT